MRFEALAPFARKLIRTAALGSALWAGAGIGAQAADSLFNVAKVSVDTTAKNAVAARNSGMAEAQMRAWKIVLGRLVPLDAQGLLPEFTKEEVEQLVLGVAVRKEQNSTTRYIGSLDVNFNEAAVKQLLVSFGIPYSENRAPPIYILPLMLNDVSGEGSTGWRQAWSELDLSNSVTPATVLPLRTDVDPAMLKRAAAGDQEAIATVQSAYGYGSLVMAVGNVKDGNFISRLIGEDAVGAIDFSQSAAMRGGAEAAEQDAAAAAFAILENRWKVMRSGGEMPAAAYDWGQQPQDPEQAPDEPAVVPRNVVALVEFSGLRDWQQIRSRLAQMAGLQALEVNSLSARTASITFDFAGSLDTLQSALSQNGFVLDDRDGTFVLRSQ